jgi:hypothetical protein
MGASLGGTGAAPPTLSLFRLVGVRRSGDQASYRSDARSIRMNPVHEGLFQGNARVPEQTFFARA